MLLLRDVRYQLVRKAARERLARIGSGAKRENGAGGGVSIVNNFGLKILS
jgi:hypothetical protein